MRTRTYTTQLDLPRPIEDVFTFFADAHNLQEITPPWLDFRVLTPAPIDMRAGALIDYRLKLRGVPIRWRTRIAAWEPPGSRATGQARFIDEQLKGPYHLWHHEHTFEEMRDASGRVITRCIDIVNYAVPGWVLEPMVHSLFVRRDVERIFEYRQARMIERFGRPRPDEQGSRLSCAVTEAVGAR